jgi:pantothenate kinase
MNPAELCRRLAARRLTLDGTDFAPDIHLADIENVFLPLAERLALCCAGGNSDARPRRRCMVGVAGPPGAGKSVTTTILAAALDETDHDVHPLVVPLDGFHYPNAHLSAHQGLDHQGRLRCLRDLKGWHVTYDAVGALEALRSARNGERIGLPVYSRVLHEPVANALRVEESHNMVLVEGNYLLFDVDPWDRIRSLFDMAIFVTAPEDVLIAQTTERHLRGGKSPEQARAQLERVDVPNMHAVLPTIRHADLVVSGRHGRLALESRG